MMFGTLGVLNAFSTCDIFSLPWVYWDVTPLEVEEDLVYDLIPCKSLLLRKISFAQTQASIRASLVAQTVKNLPVMQEIQVQCLGWKDSWEKGMATHCSILAWEIPWTEKSMGSQSWTQLSN